MKLQPQDNILVLTFSLQKKKNKLIVSQISTHLYLYITEVLGPNRANLRILKIQFFTSFIVSIDPMGPLQHKN